MANIVTQRFVQCHDYLKEHQLVKSSRQFALAIDTLPQGLNEVLKGCRDVTVKNILNIVDVYNVSERFLLSGEGPMFKSEEVDELSSVHRDDDQNSIKYVPIPAYAGNMDQYIESVQEEDMKTFSIPGYHATYGEHRCFDVAGDSMEPTLFAGDKIVCSEVPRSNFYSSIKDKYVYVVITTSEIMVKRVVNTSRTNGCLRLLSDNTYYGAKEIPVDDVKEVWRVNLKLSPFMPDPSNMRNGFSDQIGVLNTTIEAQAESIRSLNRSVEALMKMTK